MNREEDYTIEWKNHAYEAFEVISELHRQRAFTDVTLHCGDKCFRAHRVVLAACSSYLERVLGQIARNSASSANALQHAAIVLKDAPADLLEVCVGFMYTGVAHVPSERVEAFMALAESLEVRGLESRPSATSGQCPPRASRRPATDSRPSLAAKRKAPPESRSDFKSDSAGSRRPEQNRQISETEGVATTVVSATQNYEEDDIEEIPVVKSEVPAEEEAWDEAEEADYGGGDYQEEAEAEFDVNDSYPMEYASNIPQGISTMTLERVSRYLWRGWLERLGSSGPPLHFCSLCGYRSVQVGNAKRHERTHTMETPFECPTCGRCFRDSSNLNVHSVAAHGIPLTKRRPGVMGEPSGGLF